LGYHFLLHASLFFFINFVEIIFRLFGCHCLITSMYYQMLAGFIFLHNTVVKLVHAMCVVGVQRSLCHLVLLSWILEGLESFIETSGTCTDILWWINCKR
jgi:hypothetical protein